jgi:hypothetical protein
MTASSSVGRRPIINYGGARRFGMTDNPWVLTGLQQDAYCGMLVALRRGDAEAVSYFFSHLDRELRNSLVITLVPGHVPGPHSPGLRAIGRALAAKGRTDGTACLVRTLRVPALSKIPERDYELHASSISVVDAHVVVGRSVLLLDDVALTGYSIRACEELLYRAGAAEVQCVVLGRIDSETEPLPVPRPPAKRPAPTGAGQPLPKESVNLPPSITPVYRQSRIQPSRPACEEVARPKFINPQQSSTGAGQGRDVSELQSKQRASSSGPKVRTGSRAEPDKERQPKGAGPDYSRMRRTTRPSIVDSEPGPKYEEMLRRFGAIGNVD